MEKLSTHRWTREAHERMIDCGILTRHDRVELLNGEIVGMPLRRVAVEDLLRLSS